MNVCFFLFPTVWFIKRYIMLIASLSCWFEHVLGTLNSLWVLLKGADRYSASVLPLRSLPPLPARPLFAGQKSVVRWKRERWKRSWWRDGGDGRIREWDSASTVKDYSGVRGWIGIAVFVFMSGCCFHWLVTSGLKVPQQQFNRPERKRCD